MLFILLSPKNSFSIWPEYNQKHKTEKRQEQVQQEQTPYQCWPKADQGSAPAEISSWSEHDQKLKIQAKSFCTATQNLHVFLNSEEHGKSPWR